MSDDVKKSYERSEIQAALEPVIEAKLSEMNVPDDDDHTRRKVRTLARMGAKIAISKGCNPQAWMAICYEVYVKEAGLDKATTPEEAKAILEAKLNAKGETN
jgi:hypothetical protein